MEGTPECPICNSSNTQACGFILCPYKEENTMKNKCSKCEQPTYEDQWLDTNGDHHWCEIANIYGWANQADIDKLRERRS